MRRCGNATLGALVSVSHTHSTATCTFFVAALLIYSIARSPALVPSSFFLFLFLLLQARTNTS